MKVDSVVADVARILQDTAQVRWKRADHEANLNAAIREVISLRTDAYTQVRAMQLAQGTEQVLTGSGLFLVDILANLGAGGGTIGNSPRRVDIATLDSHRPGWRNDTADGAVRNFVFDPRTPKRFEVWPPQPNPPHYVRVLQTEYPAAVTVGNGQDFPLDDRFINPTVHLSLYFGWQKATGGDLNRAGYHRSEALQMLGVSGQAQLTTQQK